MNDERILWGLVGFVIGWLTSYLIRATINVATSKLGREQPRNNLDPRTFKGK